MIELIVIGGGITATAAIGLTVAYKRVTAVMPFLFANAKIQARGKYILSEPKKKSLSEKKSLTELIGFLKDTEHAPYLENVTNFRDLHIKLEKSLIDRAKELKEMSPKNFQEVLEAYLMFYETKVLKTVYRSRFFSGYLTDIDKNYVFPVGKINDLMIQRLLETKTIADINTVMASTNYSSVFSKEYSQLKDFEIELDNCAFNYFTSVLDKIKIYDKKPILELLNYKLDILNLLVLIKCIIRKVDKTERKNLLIKNKGLLQNEIDVLVNANSIKEIVEACKKTKYGSALQKAFEKYESDFLLSHFEVELYRFFKQSLLDSELYHIQGPYPLFSYLLKKELEVKNIMIISKGIESNFSQDEIKELLL
ncbi:MAG: V-type ATPase subunit [Candidatus Diapherotrites archaeon]|nr:V-type ATPase subunit [Candidatus Diapherotrites archaeon]